MWGCGTGLRPVQPNSVTGSQTRGMALALTERRLPLSYVGAVDRLSRHTADDIGVE